jgi:hypothetical protein
MSQYHRHNLTWTPAGFIRLLGIVIGLALMAAPVMALPPNPDCTLIVPNNPLTAVGLATPYRLVATNPAHGPCHETEPDQSAFVQAAIIDLLSGQISIYNPLVVDSGTLPAAPPVVPTLPLFSVVALWFGYNGDTLTLVGASPNVLTGADCHQGMGQFAYCNAPAFFAAANFEILIAALHVPPLGFGADGQVCPSVRSFFTVDQDQSDNLPTEYLVTPAHLLAQSTAANLALFPGSTPLKNASDNRLTAISLDSALGCTPWKAPDLANPGHTVPALPLNELQAALYQPAPAALIPLGDPFVLNPTFTGVPDLAKVNLYRAGVNQLPALTAQGASTTTYCANVSAIATQRLLLDRPFLTVPPSPVPGANSLFTFMAQRFVGTYEMLNCEQLLGQPDPITLIEDANHIVVDAVIQ